MKKAFVTYVRTLQFWQTRLKDKSIHEPVYISSKEIKERFNLSKSDIQSLINATEIEVTAKPTLNGNKAYYYRALQAGAVNLTLMKRKSEPHTSLTVQMEQYLKDVSLIENSPSTLYFDTFLQFKKNYLSLFFTIDSFSKRIHTPVTNFKSEYRQNILIKGEKTRSLDVATMQPLLLGKILFAEIGNNEFSNWINNGEDIYTMLQSKAGLKNRDEGKERFFQIIFGEPSNELNKLFNGESWICWVNNYKSIIDNRNPHTHQKPYSNLAWLLQTNEVALMKNVWQGLINSNIPFLSVHDEVIVRNSDLEQARQIFESVLNSNFKYYKLNCKAPEQPLNTIQITPQYKGNQMQLITELEQYFSEITLPAKPINFDKCGTITDISLFINSHLATVKTYQQSNIAEPYFNRLLNLKNILHHEHETNNRH
jgi:hypothetical protein